MGESLDLNSGKGLCRTDMHCHNCGKNFLARIDFDIEGNHEVECPICGHIHFRVIVAGVITEERWNSSYSTVRVNKRNVWKHNDLAMKTSSAAEFLRDLWLNPTGETA
jgi:DNA-directed RNA polymerase subunit RPC12/RpoP